MSRRTSGALTNPRRRHTIEFKKQPLPSDDQFCQDELVTKSPLFHGSSVDQTCPLGDNSSSGLSVSSQVGQAGRIPLQASCSQPSPLASWFNTPSAISMVPKSFQTPWVDVGQHKMLIESAMEVSNTGASEILLKVSEAKLSYSAAKDIQVTSKYKQLANNQLEISSTALRTSGSLAKNQHRMPLSRDYQMEEMIETDV
ncbi:unnamed protein product [Protopolystoma xenopodis]|uniref:Uncharacterized protein n=1 Tax=Protopolystoma xenopodis TaxID=117903 RepID=A0A448WRA6_9PLAT|nr:unnamed protein product [Protopolystoma xenopodis]